MDANVPWNQPMMLISAKKQIFKCGAFDKEAGIGPTNWFPFVVNICSLGSLKPISSGRDPENWLKLMRKSVTEERLNKDGGKGPSSLLAVMSNITRLAILPRAGERWPLKLFWDNPKCVSEVRLPSQLGIWPWK